MPVVGFIQGVWMVGVIDELRMPVTGNDKKLTLVDTKTRARPRLPAEPQCRNGRLQLKCYKHLWDNLVCNNFPSEHFYEFFSMDPQHILSDEVKMNAANSGFPAETLGEVERYFNNACSVLPPADDQLLLRWIEVCVEGINKWWSEEGGMGKFVPPPNFGVSSHL
ncbi:Exonuclease V chloroplastic [Bienertia sinuspersici]